MPAMSAKYLAKSSVVRLGLFKKSGLFQRLTPVILKYHQIRLVSDSRAEREAPQYKIVLFARAKLRPRAGTEIFGEFPNPLYE